VKNRSLRLGLAIIAAGVVVALGQLGVFRALGAWLWPLIPLAGGALLYAGASNRRLPSLFFVPGVALAGSSAALLLCAWFGWGWMKALWPAIPLSVAAGLFLFAFEERFAALRTASLALGAVSLVALLVTLLLYVNAFVIALLLIVVGVIAVARRPDFR